MRQLKIFIILFLCCLPIRIVADSNGDNQPSSSNTIILSKSSSATKRPNAPARDFIECHYGAGYLEFGFSNNISSLTVELYNDTDSWAGFVTVETPIIETPVFEGEYTIQCTTNDGRIFKGIIDF